MNNNTEFERIVKNYYNKNAEHYFKCRLKDEYLFNEFIEKPLLLDLFDNMRDFSYCKVLDVGCGPGFYTKYFAEKKAHVTSIDVSFNMLKCAKKFCRENLSKDDYMNIKFMNVPLSNLSPNRYSFDLILCTFIIGYISNLDLFFSQVSSLLKEKGLLVLSMIHPVKAACIYHNGYSIIGNYFSKSPYETDFISKKNPILLHRHHLEDITQHSSKSNLLIERIFEPKPVDKVPTNLLRKSLEYKQKPSVLLLFFRKII